VFVRKIGTPQMISFESRLFEQRSRGLLTTGIFEKRPTRISLWLDTLTPGKWVFWGSWIFFSEYGKIAVDGEEKPFWVIFAR